MYWPARNCSRSFAGSLSCTMITSSATLVELLHAAGQQPHRDVLRRADGAALDHQLAERLRLAEKRLAVRPLLVREHPRVVVAVVDRAR